MGLLKRVIEISSPYKLWNSINWALKKVRLHPSVLILGNGQNLKINSGTKIGAGTVLDVSGNGIINIGKNCWFYKDIEMRTSGELSIGNGATLQKGVTLNGNIKIGAGCILAPHIFMSSGSHIYNFMPGLPIREQEKIFAIKKPEITYDKPISVGEDCWIGINVVVSPGVDIGRGCIIGASSVVTKSVPPYSIVAGIPAKVIGSRLQWAPPKHIDATQTDLIPYLYEGFDISIDNDKAFAYFGPYADSHAIVAMAGKGEKLELAFESSGSGSIEIEGLKKEFKSGINKISYNLKSVESEEKVRYLKIGIPFLSVGCQLRLLQCSLI